MASQEEQNYCFVTCSDCGRRVKVELGDAIQCPYCGQWVASWQADEDDD